MVTPQRATMPVVVERIRDGRRIALRDELVVEEPLEIRVAPAEGTPVSSLATTMRTPGHDFELVAGFLLAEGVIAGRDDLSSMSYCLDAGEQQYNVVTIQLQPWVHFDAEELRRNVYTSASCGVCGKSSLEAIRRLPRAAAALAPEVPVLSVDLMRRLPAALRRAQRLFQRTGGLHASALFDAEGTRLVLREDVGRHNATDKVIGERLLAGKLPLRDLALLVSGRASFEIMQKALAAGIPIVLAVGPPSSLAVDVAREYGQTLVGFLSEAGWNIYAGGQRIRD